MSSDAFIVEMDTAAVLAALDRLGADAAIVVKRASGETANAIVREAFARLERQLGPEATGKTARGIQMKDDRDGGGYIVQSARDPFPMLPVWLEKGTKRGGGTHPNVARPYFYASAMLEEGPHRRRLEEALQSAIDNVGLGD